MNNGIRMIALTAAVIGSAALPITHQVQAAPATPRCHSGELYIAPVPKSGQGGMGHIGFVLQVRSFAQHRCYVDGYPGVQLADATGRFLPTRLRWGSGYLFGNPAKKMITLRTGQSVYFGLEWVHMPTGNEVCPIADNLLVTPPDEKVSIVVSASGIDACGGGLTATPLVSTIMS